MSYSLVEDDVKPSYNDEKSFGEKSLEAGKEQVRTIARMGARGAEFIGGIPGDVLSLIHNFIGAPIAENVFGEKKVPYEQTHIGKWVPTHERNRENLKNIIKSDYLEPKNEVERFADDVWTDAVGLALPSGKGKIPFKNTLGKALGKSLGANIVGEGVKDLSGGDEQKGGWAKLGSLFLLSLLDKKKAGKYIGEMYQEAEQAIPKNASVNVSNLQTYLVNLRNKMLKGTGAPSEKFIVDEAESILQKIKNGKLSPEEAWASKRSINEKLEKILYETPQKAAQAGARKFAKGIVHELNGVLEDYGQQNPEFLKKFKDAEQGFSTIGKSNVLSRFVEKNLKYSPLTAGLMHLFHGSVGSTISSTAIPYHIGKLAYRIYKSPVLRKYYSQAIGAAAKEDSAVFNKNIEHLDKEMQKEQEKDTYELVD